MKNTHSLEQERQALLEQIHSSRAAYRRMLAQYDQPDQPAGSAAYGHDSRLQTTRHVSGMPAAFPRSRTLRWVVDHPYAVAGAAAGLVALAVLGPRGFRTGVASVQRRMHKEPTVQSGHWRGAPVVREVVVQKPSSAGAAMAGVMGLATMLLRDPQRIQMAIRTANNAWQWMQSQRRGGASARPARGRGMDWIRPSTPGR